MLILKPYVGIDHLNATFKNVLWIMHFVIFYYVDNTSYQSFSKVPNESKQQKTSNQNENYTIVNTKTNQKKMSNYIQLLIVKFLKKTTLTI